MEKERKRVKKYYVKTSEITTKEKKEQRNLTQERVTKFRKIRQKTKEPEEINEKTMVAIEFSSKSQKLSAHKISKETDLKM